MQRTFDYINNNKVDINSISIQIELRTKEHDDLSDQWRVA
jgi:hypothetical protein